MLYIRIYIFLHSSTFTLRVMWFHSNNCSEKSISPYILTRLTAMEWRKLLKMTTGVLSTSPGALTRPTTSSSTSTRSTTLESFSYHSVNLPGVSTTSRSVFTLSTTLECQPRVKRDYNLKMGKNWVGSNRVQCETTEPPWWFYGSAK